MQIYTACHRKYQNKSSLTGMSACRGVLRVVRWKDVSSPAVVLPVSMSSDVAGNIVGLLIIIWMHYTCATSQSAPRNKEQVRQVHSNCRQLDESKHTELTHVAIRTRYRPRNI